MKVYPRVRDTAFELAPCVVEKLTMHRAGPYCGGDLGGRQLDEGVGDGGAQLTCGKLIERSKARLIT